MSALTSVTGSRPPSSPQRFSATKAHRSPVRAVAAAPAFEARVAGAPVVLLPVYPTLAVRDASPLADFELPGGAPAIAGGVAIVEPSERLARSAARRTSEETWVCDIERSLHGACSIGDPLLLHRCLRVHVASPRPEAYGRRVARRRCEPGLARKQLCPAHCRNADPSRCGRRHGHREARRHRLTLRLLRLPAVPQKTIDALVRWIPAETITLYVTIISISNTSLSKNQAFAILLVCLVINVGTVWSIAVHRAVQTLDPGRNWFSEFPTHVPCLGNHAQQRRPFRLGLGDPRLLAPATLVLGSVAWRRRDHRDRCRHCFPYRAAEPRAASRPDSAVVMRDGNDPV